MMTFSSQSFSQFAEKYGIQEDSFHFISTSYMPDCSSLWQSNFYLLRLPFPTLVGMQNNKLSPNDLFQLYQVTFYFGTSQVLDQQTSSTLSVNPNHYSSVNDLDIKSKIQNLREINPSLWVRVLRAIFPKEVVKIWSHVKNQKRKKKKELGTTQKTIYFVKRSAALLFSL